MYFLLFGEFFSLDKIPFASSAGENGLPGRPESTGRPITKKFSRFHMRNIIIYFTSKFLVQIIKKQNILRQIYR
jgi:hypothetical protein